MKYNKNKKNGFTLVELLAVIVILAIILVIAVPKVMSIIEDAKMGTLESTAKMIASGAEKQKVQNTVLGNTKEITCDSVAKINKGDYVSCSIEFDNNTAKVTIEGSGKFDGLWVCDGTKTNAVAIKGNSCEPVMQSIEVKHPLFLKGQSLTPDKFEVIATYNDGSTKKLRSGGMKADETAEVTTITSPNWPNNYSDSMTEEENYWEAIYEGAEAIQITFDATSETEAVAYDYIVLYDKEGNEKYRLGGTNFAGRTYTITGDYIKVTMVSDGGVNGKGFSATIKPANNVDAEYTASPSVVPNTEGNFDITITANGQNISKKITTNVGPYDVEDYVASHKGFDTVQTMATYNGRNYDAGTRYIGSMDEVNNKVYYNCDDTDSAGVSYGADNYDYINSCEIWRIIGVFDTKTSESGNAVPRVKLINTSSTFGASWDSSYANSFGTGINKGYGINQWGESTYSDGSSYEGADLMRLLNGYYISKEGATCTYCDDYRQKTCSKTCTSDSLKSANMKVLTSTAKEMIENAVWDTYAVKYPDDGETTFSFANAAYLQEKGISAQYTGKSECEAKGSDSCNDDVVRTTSWTGLVGLMSASDLIYSNNWLNNLQYGFIHFRSITPYLSLYDNDATFVWAGVVSDDSVTRYIGGNGLTTSYDTSVRPSVYLKPNIKIISGNGGTEPYILSIQ